MSAAFVDTFFWIALLNRSEPWHAQVVAYRQPKRLITSSAVLLEVMDAYCGIELREVAGKFWKRCHSDPPVEIVPADSPLLDQAFDLYASRPDKAWSLTDCISFVIMTDRGLQLALTADRHFEQAGFQRAFA